MKKTRILVVEDERIIAEDIKTVLQKLGYEVLDIIGSGEEAIDVSGLIKPDLVLMDVILETQMSGIEAANEIMNKFDIPIIFLTAYADEKTIKKATSFDFYGYLVKPFKEKELHATIQMAINKHKSEQRIKESQEKYKNIFENIQDVYFEIEPTGIIKEISNSIINVIAVPRENLLGKSLFDLFCKINNKELFLKKILNNNKISEFEVDLKNKKDRVPCSINAKLFLDFESQPKKIIGSLRNIAERKIAESKIKRLAEEWKTTFDSIGDLVSIQDINYRFVRVNQSFAKVFNKKPEEFVGKKCYEVVHDYDAPFLNCPLKKTLLKKAPVTEEFFEPKLDIYLQVSTSPIFDSENNITGVVHIAKDVSERKASEKSLIELKKAIETMHLGVTITDTRGKIIYTNAREASLHGYTVGELLGKDVGIFSPPEMRNQLSVDEIKQLNGWVRESVNIKKDSTTFPVRLMSDVVKDHKGNVFGVVTTCEDLTEGKKAEKSLIELRKAIETLKLGVTISNIKGNIIYTNNADAKMHGYTVPELIGKDVGIFGIGELRNPMSLEEIKKLNGLARESVNVRKDGSKFPVRLISDVVKDSAGRALAIVTTCEDISERKKAEEEVKRLAAIVESSEDAILGETLDGIIVSWNLGAKNIFGYKPEEVKGKSDRLLAPDDRKNEIGEIILEVEKGKFVENFETVRKRKDGRLIEVSLTVSPIKDATGRIIGISTIARDITEKKAAERALITSEVKFRNVFENIQDVYFEVTYKGIIKELSPSIKNMSKFTREELINKSIYNIYANPKQRFGLLRQLLQNGRVDDYEIDLKDKDGVPVPCSVVAIIKMDKNGKPETLIGSMRNISDRKYAEEQLRIAKEKAELLNWLVPSSIFTVDTKKRITSWNNKIEEVTGYSASEVIGKKCTLFAVSPCENKCGLFNEDVIKPLNCRECTIRTKSGEIRVISKNADILRDKNGNFIGGIESFEDVTDRKIAEKKLRDSEEKYRLLVENLEDEYFFYEHDNNRNFTYVSPSIKSILGYTQEDFMENHMIYLVPSKANKKVAEYTELCIHGKPQPAYKVEIYHKDGNVHIIEVSEFPKYDNKNNIIGVQGIGHNITERIKAENDLKASEKRFKDISLSIADWIWEVDTRGVYTYCSEHVEHILGYSADEIIGKTPFDLMPDEEAGKIRDIFSKVLERKESFNDLENLNVHKNGTEIYLMTSGVPIFDDSGKLLGYRGVDKDITLKKNAEKIKSELLKKLESANKELKDFAYIVSHDLKAPLRAINTLANWISTDYADKFDEDGKEQMQLLISRVDRMHNLIEGVLQYSRVGRIIEERSDVDLQVIVPEIIDSLSPPENIKVIIDNELPTINFENTRIRQVFQNLLSNAIKYMDKPEGIINVGCSEENKYWKFSVKDNGPGIDEKHFEKIFQIFQTLQSRDQYESTGIGLTTIKKIVEMYSGMIWLESEVGKGSTFFFTIPK